MISRNPKTLRVGGADVPIRWDMWAALDIIRALGDPNLSPEEKNLVMLMILYPGYGALSDIGEALTKATWFLDCGREHEERRRPALMDWDKDFELIVPAVNEVVGYDVCEREDVHWWTFVRAYMQIFSREGNLFAGVIGIREKLKRGKKLEKNERAFYNENRAIIDLPVRISDEDQAFFDSIMNGGE